MDKLFRVKDFINIIITMSTISATLVPLSAITVKPPLLALGPVGDKSQIVTTTAPYTTDTLTEINDLCLTSGQTRPTPNEDCALSTITWQARKGFLTTLRDILASSTYNCENVVQRAVDTLNAKIGTTTTTTLMDSWINMTRGDWFDLENAYGWISATTSKTVVDSAIAGALIKTVQNTIQSNPSDKTLELNLSIHDNKSELETLLDSKLGLDDDFATLNADVINQVPATDVLTRLEDGLADGPTLLGVGGSNNAPIAFGSDGLLGALADIDSKRVAADNAAWARSEDELKDFCGEKSWLVPIKNQIDVVQEMVLNPYVTTPTTLFIKGATTSGGTEAEYETIVDVITPAPSSEVLAAIGDSALIDLDWAVETVMSPESRTLLKTNNIKTVINLVKDDVILHSNNLKGLKVDFHYRSLIRPGKTYTAVGAISLSNVLKRVWSAVKKVRISDIEDVTNTVATGLSVIGQASGIQGLVNASTVLETMASGLGTIQTLASKYKTKVPSLPVSTGQVASSLALVAANNIIPTAFVAGKSMRTTKNASDSQNVVRSINQATQVATTIKDAVLTAANVTVSKSYHSLKVKRA